MKHKINYLITICILIAVVLFTGMWVIRGGTDSPVYTVTAYCPCEECCGCFSDGITASGHIIQPGDKFAAAPSEMPYGTILEIPGYGVVPVLDRGPKSGRLDVFFQNHQEALEFGVQELKVKILERSKRMEPLERAERITKLTNKLYWTKITRDYFTKGRKDKKRHVRLDMFPARETVGDGQKVELYGELREKVVDIVLDDVNKKIAAVEDEIKSLMSSE